VFFRADNFVAAGRMLGGMAGFHGMGWEVFHRSHMRWPMVICAMAFCFFAPNTQHFMSLARPALGILPPLPDERAGRLLWRPNVAYAMVTAAAAIASILYLSRASEFIYYQF
jgi:hypothetical protein